MTADIVIPVRSGPADSYEELRYTLRSIEAFYPEHGEIFLLGSAPRWVTGVNHLKVSQGSSKYVNVRRLHALACASDLIGDGYVYFNDDIMLWNAQEGPLRMFHGGPLRAYLDRTGRRDAHAQGGRKTLEFMKQRWGYTEPLNWGLHVPIVIHKDFMREALEAVGDSSTAYHMRTIYGTLSELWGEPHRDVKIMSSAAPDPAWLYVSTSDISFRTRAVGKAIKARFPEKSRFEI